ncbi:hypothetical protein [Kitasatospora sp. A2-31]|uniref:hypothetical protein n=1 Tax=Kitasatospora sp. A2-31 TaxID=2916414 RepID=UPI0027E2CDFB|nr:hypothetical protein [Kitasatospora sp. A2-31]
MSRQPGEILPSHPLDSVVHVNASAATLHELADHLATIETDQLDQLLGDLLQDGGLLHAAERLLDLARAAVDPDLDETHPDPGSVPAYRLMHALARLGEEVWDCRMAVLESLSAVRTRDLDPTEPSPAHPASRSAAVNPTARPRVTILRTDTGDITATGYDPAAQRILLRAGFEEVHLRSGESWLRLPSDGNQHGPDPRACSAASELLAVGYPVRLDGALGQPVTADGTPLPGTPVRDGDTTSRADAARTATGQPKPGAKGTDVSVQVPVSGPVAPPRSR